MLSAVLSPSASTAGPSHSPLPLLGVPPPGIGSRSAACSRPTLRSPTAKNTTLIAHRWSFPIAPGRTFCAPVVGPACPAGHILDMITPRDERPFDLSAQCSICIVPPVLNQAVWLCQECPRRYILCTPCSGRPWPRCLHPPRPLVLSRLARTPPRRRRSRSPRGAPGVPTPPAFPPPPCAIDEFLSGAPIPQPPPPCAITASPPRSPPGASSTHWRPAPSSWSTSAHALWQWCYLA